MISYGHTLGVVNRRKLFDVGNQSSDYPGDAATYLDRIASEPSRDRKNEIIGPVARMVTRNRRRY